MRFFIPRPMLALACYFLVTPTGSGAELVRLAPRPLVFAIADAPPYGGKGDRDQPTGIYPAIVAELARDAGLPITVRIVPFARASTQVVNGSVDGTILFKSAVTDDRTVALVPLFSTGLVVKVRPGLVLRSKDDLAGLLIGRLRNGCAGLGAPGSSTWTFYELNSQKQGIQMLSAGRIDAFCTAAESLAIAIKEFDESKVLADTGQIMVRESDVWLLLNTKVAPEAAQSLKQAVLRMQERGALERIFREHLGRHYRLHPPAVLHSKVR